ncbi:hypothetical protein AWB75_00098 [Caballeronia catudaia]|uniref:Multidrug ABC transporter ATPase n=1 Tax=Caballeronia catudaia TaxID=1777136 RepID=A0A157Z2Q5_9BURK|nr:hypothetical protein [Caballeronia catudaia]SAK39713.1 hypothetical protein AWB75_00098 [Caballeronia catudaia]
MTRFARTARRRFGPISSTIANASRHFVPPKLSSWKLALYVIVFLLPGGSFAVLGMGWFENRYRRKPASASAPKQTSARPLLSAPCSDGAP